MGILREIIYEGIYPIYLIYTGNQGKLPEIQLARILRMKELHNKEGERKYSSQRKTEHEKPCCRSEQADPTDLGSMKRKAEGGRPETSGIARSQTTGGFIAILRTVVFILLFLRSTISQ